MDYRPMAEVIFYKKSLENLELNFEEFIAIKGIKAIGNQLSKEKIRDVELKESLPYEEPEVQDLELVDEELVDKGNDKAEPDDSESDSADSSDQPTLF